MKKTVLFLAFVMSGIAFAQGKAEKNCHEARAEETEIRKTQFEKIERKQPLPSERRAN